MQPDRRDSTALLVAAAPGFIWKKGLQVQWLPHRGVRVWVLGCHLFPALCGGVLQTCALG